MSAAPLPCAALPGTARADRSIEVLFPEHVTAVKQGTSVAEDLYRFREGAETDSTAWKQVGRGAGISARSGR